MATTSRKPRTKRSNPFAKIKRKDGKRSGLETLVAAQLTEAVGAGNFKYERQIGTIAFTDPKERKYLPDFQLPNGIIVETKGWFKTTDRRKHLLIKQQHPEKDIRFVFSNPNNKISKLSKNTYADWCAKNGFLCAKETVPQEWIDEPTKKRK